MLRAYRIMRAASLRLETASLLIANAGLAVMLACILVQIIARYAFAAPPAWTEELARYAMIWAALLGASVAYSRRADPAVVEMAAISRAWLRRLAQYTEIAAVFTLCGTVLAMSPPVLALHLGRLTDSLEAPSWLVMLIIPVSMGLILFHAATRLVGLMAGREEAGPGPVGAEPGR